MIMVSGVLLIISVLLFYFTRSVIPNILIRLAIAVSFFVIFSILITVLISIAV